MRGFNPVQSQQDLDHLWEAADGFLDTEIVDLRFSKIGEMREGPESGGLRNFLRCSARAVEVVATQVEELCLDEPSWVSEDVAPKGRFSTDRVSGLQRIALALPWGRLHASHLFWRTHDRQADLTRRLLSDVPGPGMVPAVPLPDGWRQCSACADAWLDPAERIYCLCPSCKVLTELTEAPQ